MLTDKEKEILLPKFHEYNLKHSFISWAYAQRENDKEIEQIVEMTSRPCYGEMRAYGAKSTRPGDHKPSDLPRPMKPAGGDTGIFREAVAVPFRYYHENPATPTMKELSNRWARFLFGPNSPYVAGLDTDNLEFTTTEDGRICGIVMHGTEVDPTCMVACFMANRGATLTVQRMWATLVDDFGATEREAFLLAFNFSAEQYPTGDLFFLPYAAMSYMQSPLTDPKRLVTQDFERSLSNNRTWRDGEDYNRPNLADGFVRIDHSERKKLDELFKDIKFDKVPGVPGRVASVKEAAPIVLERISAAVSS